jgi:hypothetical protein
MSESPVAKRNTDDMSDTDNGFADFFDATPPQSNPLRDELLAMIRTRDRITPRHLQVELGPSDVAHPCMRRLAYGMMAEPGSNPPFDPLPSIIGTAVHSWLQSAARYANEALGRVRWMTETTVQVAPGLRGSCDLYDRDTGTVVDWKVVGTPRLRTYRKDPGPAYKTQVYLYGRGFENAGLPVNTVAIAFVPRGATLHSLHVWSADYDPKVADWALDRRTQVMGLLDDLQPQEHPERYRWIPATQYDCRFCKFYSTNPQSPIQCPGDGT